MKARLLLRFLSRLVSMLMVWIRVVMVQIASSLTTLEHNFGTNLVAIVRLSNQGHEINEALGQVEVHPSVFARGIVLWKSVMIVVKAFANGANANQNVLHWVNALVIRFVAPHVSDTIDEPCHMQCEYVAQYGGHKVGDGETLVPAHDRYHCGQHEAN